MNIMTLGNNLILELPCGCAYAVTPGGEILSCECKESVETEALMQEFWRAMGPITDKQKQLRKSVLVLLSSGH